MKIWVVRAVLASFALATQAGCAPASANYVRLHDVDPALGAKFATNKTFNGFLDADGHAGPDREDFRIAWVDLCRPNSCDPVAQRYSKLFRDIAVANGTLRQVDLIVTAVDNGQLSTSQAQSVLDFGRRALPLLSSRIRVLAEALRRLDPNTDFRGRPATAARASNGASQAAAQLEDASARLPEVAAKLRTGATAVASAEPASADPPTAAEPAPRSTRKLHPNTEARVSRLVRQLAAFPEYAPAGTLTEDDVLRMATFRGLRVLEEELSMHAQIAEAEPATPLLFAAVIEGPETAVLDWFVARRPRAEACLRPPAQGELAIAGLHGPSGQVTGVQAIHSTLEPAVASCITAALSDGKLAISRAGGGTFKLRLTTGPPSSKPRHLEVFGAADPVPPVDDDTLDVESGLLDDLAAVGPRDSAPAGVVEPTATHEDIAADYDIPAFDTAPPASPSPRTIAGIAIGGSVLLTGTILGIAALSVRSNTLDAIEQGTVTEAAALDAQRRHNRLATWSLVTGTTGLGVLIATTVGAFMQRSSGTAALSFNGRELVWTIQF